MTPWELDLIDGYLSYQGAKIDIIYRRLVTTDLEDIMDEVPKLIEGIKAGKTLFFGPITSQIIHNKILFRVLHDKRARKHFREDQLQWIQRHIPFTAVVDEEVLRDQHYVYEKDDYLLKPMDSYASRGIFVGKDMTEADWKSLLEAVAGRDYLIQRFAVLPGFNSMDYDTGEVASFHQLTGIFVYDGKLQGFFTRSGRANIVAGHQGGKSQGTLSIKKKS